MKRAFLPITLLFAAAAVALQERPKPSLLFQLVGHHVDWPAATPDGNRIYYQLDSSEVRLFDRRTSRHTRVFVGRVRDIAVSSAGDRLAFVKKAEESDDRHIWTIALDPATGLAAGAPRRVSLSVGYYPAFSPDGRSIAFAAGVLASTTKDLTIVPTSGGPERVLVANPGDVWPIQWTPDGQSIFYGSSQDTKMAGAVNGTFRVAAAGGSPQKVLDNADWGANPGLSPDGKTILAWSRGWDSIVAYTAAGMRIRGYVPLREEAEPMLWMTATRGMWYDNIAPRRLNVASLTDGRVRFATDSMLNLADGTWSPDGMRLAAVGGNNTPRGFTIVDAKGNVRLIRRTMASPPSNFIYWSPDGRQLAFITRSRELYTLDVATGAERSIAKDASPGLPIRWTAGGRALRYGSFDSTMAADSTRGLEIREAQLAGGTRSIRSLRTRCPAASQCFQFLSDSTILTRDAGQYRAMGLTRADTGTLLLKRRDGPQPVPFASPNGRWVAVRERQADQSWAVHVLSSDGSIRRRVALPATPTPGTTNPFVSNDGSEIVVIVRAAPDVLPAVYRIATVSGKATKVMDLPENLGGVAAREVSPDGKSIMFATALPSRGRLLEIDLTSFLR